MLHAGPGGKPWVSVDAFAHHCPIFSTVRNVFPGKYVLISYQFRILRLQIVFKNKNSDLSFHYFTLRNSCDPFVVLDMIKAVILIGGPLKGKSCLTRLSPPEIGILTLSTIFQGPDFDRCRWTFRNRCFRSRDCRLYSTISKLAFEYPI